MLYMASGRQVYLCCDFVSIMAVLYNDKTTIILTKSQHKYTCLPEAIYSICTPDDGWNCHPKHVE